MHNTGGTTTARFSIARFVTSSTIDGTEVVDTDGRSVTGSYTNPGTAVAVADQLNAADVAGPAALRRAFGVILEADEFVLDDELEAVDGEIEALLRDS